MDQEAAMAGQLDTLRRRKVRRASRADGLYVWVCTALFVGLSAMAAVSVWAAYR